MRHFFCITFFTFPKTGAIQFIGLHGYNEELDIDMDSCFFSFYFSYCFCQLETLTINELLLPLDDFITDRPLFVILQYEQIPPPDLVLLQQRIALHLHLFNLQLVHFAEQ